MSNDFWLYISIATVVGVFWLFKKGKGAFSTIRKLLRSFKSVCLNPKSRLSDEQCKKIAVGAMYASQQGAYQNSIETGKWQYLAVYFTPAKGKPGDFLFSPASMKVGELDGDTFTATEYSVLYANLEIGGNEMTITNVPVINDGTLAIGKNFDGKMDELMVWSANRSSQIESDATQPYEWNIGSWNNIFLNAYWKGDDSENVGKDSQSLGGVVDIMRGYYDNYQGCEIHITYHFGTGGTVNKATKTVKVHI